MNPLIAEELGRIPRDGLAQNLYRSAYEQARLNALGSHSEIGLDPAEAHSVALQAVRAHYPDFSPELLG
jgi:hypothetical protein